MHRWSLWLELYEGTLKSSQCNSGQWDARFSWGLWQLPGTFLCQGCNAFKVTHKLLLCWRSTNTKSGSDFTVVYKHFGFGQSYLARNWRSRQWMRLSIGALVLWSPPWFCSLPFITQPFTACDLWFFNTIYHPKLCHSLKRLCSFSVDAQCAWGEDVMAMRYNSTWVEIAWLVLRVELERPHFPCHFIICPSQANVENDLQQESYCRFLHRYNNMGIPLCLSKTQHK